MTANPFFRAAWFLSLLLVVGAALFAIGVSVERHRGDHHTETSATATNIHNEVSEAGSEGGTEVGSASNANSEGTSTEPSGHSETSEKILGINIESTGLVTVVVALSVALAVLVLVRPRRQMFLVVAGFAVLFAGFDIVEVVHQINNSRAGIATIAAGVLLIHVTAALLATRPRIPIVLGERVAA